MEKNLPALMSKSLAIFSLKQTSLLSTELNLEELEALVYNYFSKCVDDHKVPTMTGLALTLGTTRQNLLRLQHSNPTFQNMIERAKQIVVEYVEQLLLSGQPAAGFSLWLRNNDDWVDKTEQVNSQRKISDILDDLETQEGYVTTPHKTTNTFPTGN